MSSRNPNKPVHVVVYGAGVTGLTVAHELVVRGFAVTVVEEKAEISDPNKCLVGGMAATQYSFRPPANSSSNIRFAATQHIEATPIRPILGDEMHDYSTPLRIALTPGVKIEKSKKIRDGLKKLSTSIESTISGTPINSGATMVVSLFVRTEDFSVGECLAKTGLRHISQKMGIPAENPSGICWNFKPKGKKFEVRLDYFVQYAGPSDCAYISAEVSHDRKHLYPGEHGYRFFPSFYRNLHDSMRRTPLYTVRAPLGRERYDEQRETAYDNLTPTVRTAYAEPDQRLIVSKRSRPRSFEELRKELETMLGRMHYTRQDLLRLNLKILRYLTSCRKRRETYESMSWWDFIEGGKFSARVQSQIQRTPEALVAMSAKHADARTQGNILMQLLLDHASDGSRTDMVLNGPTSESWLKHWRIHLELQGVEFVRGRAEAFHERTQRIIPLCKLKTRWAPNYRREHLGWDDERDSGNGDYELSIDFKEDVKSANKANERDRARARVWDKYLEAAHYHVIATDISNAKRLVRALDADEDCAVGMLQRYEINPPDREPGPGDALRFFSGIQFYFERRLDFLDGHTFYSKSPWGLTSISQTQFWSSEKKGRQYKTVLSVIVGRFDNPGISGKTLWECTAQEMAEETWAQIENSLPREYKTISPKGYYIDNNLCFDRLDSFSFRVRYRAKESKIDKKSKGEWNSGDTSHVTIVQGRRRWSDEWRLDSDKFEQWHIPANGMFMYKPQRVDERVDMYPRNGTICKSASGGDGQYEYRANADFVGNDIFCERTGQGERTYYLVEIGGGVAIRTADVCIQAKGGVATGTLNQRVHLRGDGVPELKGEQGALVSEVGVDVEVQFQVVTPPANGQLTSWNIETGEFKYDFSDKGKDKNSGPPEGRLGVNFSPFQISRSGEWSKRPGVLPNDVSDIHGADWPPSMDFRHNVYKNLILAGTYMKTYTRLSTMESANESGRHAVNTILADLKTHGEKLYGEPCEIWDLEEHELDDLANLKLLDEALFDSDLPHFADILELDKIPDMMVDRRHDDLSLRPDFERLSRVLRNHPELPLSGVRMLRKATGRGFSELFKDMGLPTGVVDSMTDQGATSDWVAKQIIRWLSRIGDHKGDE